MNADGSSPAPLTHATSQNGQPNSNSYEPEWSPDGKQIAFGSDRNGHLDIYAMNADGTHVVQLTGKVGH
jgi:TolB protein